MWCNNGCAILPKQYHCQRQSVRTIMVVSALVIAIIFVVVTVRLIPNSLVPLVEEEKQRIMTWNSSGVQNIVQNVSIHLNKRTMDYGKGQLASWGYYIPKDGLFFCPVPKVACAEWKRAMRWIGGLEDWEKIEHDSRKQGNIPIFAITDESTGVREYTEKTIDALKQGYNYTDVLSDPGIVKMMVVRNPTTRLVSGFIQKCLHAREYTQCPYLHAFPSIWNGNPPSEQTAETDAQYEAALDDDGCFSLGAEGACKDIFAEFITYLDLLMNRHGRCRINPHFRPQSCFCEVWKHRDQFTLLPFRRMGEAAVESLAKSRVLDPDERHRIVEFITWRMSTPHDDKGKITNSNFYADRLYDDNNELKAKVHRLYAYDYELIKDVIQWA